MKRYRSACVLIGVIIAITGFFGYGEAKEAEKKELKPMVRVSPNDLTFNCNIVERGKQVAATNASNLPMTMNARTADSWIAVAPAAHPDVRPGGTASFTITVDCRELKGAKAWVGTVTIEGTGSAAKVRVTAKPKLEPAPRTPK